MFLIGIWWTEKNVSAFKFFYTHYWFCTYVIAIIFILMTGTTDVIELYQIGLIKISEFTVIFFSFAVNSMWCSYMAQMLMLKPTVGSVY